MKILETSFLVLTILVPLFFIIIGLSDIKYFKKSKKRRNALIKFILLGAMVNGTIYGGVKMYNTRNANEIGTEKKEEKNVPMVDNSSSESTSSEKPTDDPNKTSKGFTIEVRDGVTYVDGYLLVNKTYPLPSTYVPTGTHKEVTTANCQECIIEEAYTAYKKMRSDASNLGLSLWIASGYRSYTYQNGLYEMYVKRSGKVAADTYSARPGHSEHQSGYAFDLNSVDDSFANTKEGIWINDNCYKYGFILRYPKGKDNETGYKYESWHLRYVGTELAEKLYNGGDWITMETYFGLTSEYKE